MLENTGRERPYNTNELMSMEPIDLAEYLLLNFQIDIPPSITTVEDLEEASRILAKASTYYSFLSGMRLTARMQKRTLKRQKESQNEIEKMLAREEAFETQAQIAKTAYDTVSRMVTIKQQINQEMKMI